MTDVLNTGNLHEGRASSPLCHCRPTIKHIVRDQRVVLVVITHQGTVKTEGVTAACLARAS